MPPPTALRSGVQPVRPPRKPCIGRRSAPVKLLVSRAASEFQRGRHAEALTCAEEALRSSPELVAALDYRAASLAALGQIDEARLAFAQALAVDPDDPETLYGAADFYVSQLAGKRAELELGLNYALRGARLAQRRQNRPLAGDLLLVAAAADNDLGDSGEALRYARRALAFGVDEADARYECGVALYNLCRFGESAAALERVLKLKPDDAWAFHYLALVAERQGNAAKAEALERLARKVAPDDFPQPVDVDRKSFEVEVRRAMASLPETEQRALRGVPVEIADVPALDDLLAVAPPLSPSILGLYRGPPLGEKCLPQDGPHCRSVVLYRSNLARYARDRREFSEQVQVTLLHELGHLHGESDEDLRARGLE